MLFEFKAWWCNGPQPATEISLSQYLAVIQALIELTSSQDNL